VLKTIAVIKSRDVAATGHDYGHGCPERKDVEPGQGDSDARTRGNSIHGGNEPTNQDRELTVATTDGKATIHLSVSFGPPLPRIKARNATVYRASGNDMGYAKGRTSFRTSSSVANQKAASAIYVVFSAPLIV